MTAFGEPGDEINKENARFLKDFKRPSVSHHLKKLKEAGLLTSERRGTWVYYRVEPSVLAAMGELLTVAPTTVPR